MGEERTEARSARSVLIETLQRFSGATEPEIVDTADLFDEGILTSLSLAYVVMSLEGALSVELMSDLCTPEWKNLSSIVEVLTRKGVRP